MATRRLMTVECHWPIGVRQANLNPWSAGAWGKPGDVERWQRQGPRPRLACLSPAGVTQRDARNLYGDLSKPDEPTLHGRCHSAIVLADANGPGVGADRFEM